MAGSGGVSVDITGLPETKKLLAQYEGGKLNNRMRRGLRAGAKVFREGTRREARGRSDLPRTFRKTRTRSHRNPLGVSVSPQSPLSSIFEHGAKRHTIAPTGAILSNYSRDARRGGEPAFFARGAVSHPGMASRPLIGPVFDANEGRAKEAVADVLFEGIAK